MLSLDALRARIDEAWPPDRFHLRRLLRSIEQAEHQGKPFDRNLARLIEGLDQSVALRHSRRQAAPCVSYPAELPITARRQEILDAIERHQVVVVCGETGSGKSTQLPKLCLELGRGIDGLIGHTQPRRIAARSVAARIAQELARPLGREVGYKIRFTDSTSPQTLVKLMTDGILLAESQADRWLNQYDTIILDEAHERSLNIDFLLGYLKQLLPRRPELKLIVTSATIDAARFARHFAAADDPEASQVPVIEVSGRTYPVEIRYRPLEPGHDASEPDLTRAVVAAVDELTQAGPGDLLIFMPTEQDIHATAKALRGREVAGDISAPSGPTGVEIVPLYARLSTADQNRVFQPHEGRRIVIATNVAESSLTVPGIRYVIDSGTARIARYSSRHKVQRLPIEPVSRASADQRMGRCGRVGPGICIRLYSEDDYQSREPYTPPEIQRSNLAAVILQAKALGLGELDQFPFLDPPRPESIRDGYRTLFELGAIDDRQELTPLGRSLARLPVDPRIGRIILAGDDEGCLHEVLIIAAALAVQDPRQRPSDQRQVADEAHARFADEQSDFLAYLNLWDFFHDAKRQLSRSKLQRTCQQQFLSYNRLREWLEVHRQLLRIVATYGLTIGPRRNQYDPIHRALLAGFLSSVAWRSDRNQYTVAGGLKALIWPGSAACEKRPKWAVAGEVVETGRRYVRMVARISPRWIEELAPHLIEHEYGEPHWDPTVGSAMVFEDLTHFGLPIVRQRRTRLAPIDPPLARELLINHGLVRGGYETRARFLEHNKQLLADLEDLQRRSRRHDLMRSSDARYAFYDSRLPAEVCDGPSFERWRRQAEQRDRHVLFMNESDLLVEPRVPVDRSQFPDRITIERFDLALEYRFAPGTEADGVTVVVPQEVFHRLDPIQLEWLVPGHLQEKVDALIRALPKSLRTNFVPIPETALAVTEQLAFGAGSLPAAVGRALAVLSGEAVPLDAFRPQRVPEHLKISVKVIDSSGRTLAVGRDLRQVRGQLQAESLNVAGLAHPDWRREGLTTWEFPDLPDAVEIRQPGIQGVGYPAVVDRRQSVALELCSSRAEALEQTRAGLRRLIVLASEEVLLAQVDWLPDLDRILLQGSPIAGPVELKQSLAELIADRAFLADERLPHTAAEFARRLDESSERTGLAVQDVLPLAGPLFDAFHQARMALEGATNWQWRYAVVDVRSQLEALFPADFLTAAPWRWLTQYPRYLRAIVERFEKLGSGGLARDQQAFALVGSRWDAYRELVRQQASDAIYDPELLHYRWLVEEYRVSLFAQRLGTAVPVSDKRLDEQWAKVGKF